MQRTIGGDSGLEVMAQDLLKTSGKRLRPSLTLALANNKDKVADGVVINAAAAVEFLHLASLVHDDILDNADVRWHRPTINTKDSGQALLLGDFLVAKAMELASKANNECAHVLATTFADMSIAQNQELTDLYKKNRSKNSYLKVTAGKTASLFSAACQIGGLCAGLSAREIKALAGFGEAFGMAYQLIDDVLDFVSSEKLLGKPVGRDAAAGNYTLPLLISMNGTAGANLNRVLKSKTASELTDLLRDDGSIDKTISEARKYASLAERQLRALKDDKFVGLKRLTGEYLNWSLQNLVPRAKIIGSER